MSNKKNKGCCSRVPTKEGNILGQILNQEEKIEKLLELSGYDEIDFNSIKKMNTFSEKEFEGGTYYEYEWKYIFSLLEWNKEDTFFDDVSAAYISQYFYSQELKLYFKTESKKPQQTQKQERRAAMERKILLDKVGKVEDMMKILNKKRKEEL